MAAPVTTSFEPGHRAHFVVVAGPAQHIEGRRMYPVRCDCGAERMFRPDWIGRVKSCGCKRAALTAAACRTHGMSESPEYQAWVSMRSRCADPSNSQYKNYGARGITVCASWQGSFEGFLGDMGMRPSPAHSIDRIDNDGAYGPHNCRWATASEQARNRRVACRVEFRGEMRSLAGLCDEFGFPYHLVYQRIFRYGVSVERALSTPNCGRGRKRRSREIV